MKDLKTLIIILICFVQISCKAQIIPIESYHEYPTDIPDGAHVKDLNNLLDKFLGTWIGVFENNSIELYIIEDTDTTGGADFDIVRIFYKVTDSSDNVLLDTTSPIIEDEFIISGMYFQDDDLFETYVLDYIGMGCRYNGDLFITVEEANPITMLLSLNRYEGRYENDCEGGIDMEFFPAGQQFMSLTKQ